MPVSDIYLAVTVNTAAVAKHHGAKAFINMSQMTLSHGLMYRLIFKSDGREEWKKLNPLLSRFQEFNITR
jgi:hypothetical protein